MLYRYFNASLFFLMFIFFYGCQSTDKKSVEAVRNLMVTYAIGFDTLEIPDLELSYLTNLKAMAFPDTLNRQEIFFQQYQEDLSKIDATYLPENLLRDYEILDFEISLQLERIELERHHQSVFKSRPISEEGIYFVPNGKAWYRHYLKRWLMADVEPEEIIEFGTKKIQAVQRDIQKLQRDLGFRTDTLAFYEHLNEPLFKEKSKRKIQRLFEARQEIVKKRLTDCFKNTSIPPPNIDHGKDTRLSEFPAYYNAEKVKIMELYRDSIPAFYQYLPQSIYLEGWATYVEELGEEMGLYRTLYDLMGKHEWNLVRSVRVVLDVGLNYRGWSDQKALAYWKTNINNQEDIAIREINRIRRWPVQGITGKYGSVKLLEKRRAKKLKGGFNLKKFHQEILSRGGIF